MKYKKTEKEIIWTRKKQRVDAEFEYTTSILNHGDHVSIEKVTSINGVYFKTELVHVPVELFDDIKKLEDNEKSNH